MKRRIATDGKNYYLQFKNTSSKWQTIKRVSERYALAVIWEINRT